MVLIEELSVDDAGVLKERGNEAFRQKRYTEAVSVYTEALSLDSSADLKASLLFNRATSLFHLQNFTDCVSDCTEALTLNPEYVKVYYRRALANEQLNLFEEAVSDFDKLFDLDPPSRSLHAQHYNQLSKKREMKFNADKEEMMASLKSMGNSLLGNFGLSLDQFKFDKDPSTGNYSVRMDNPS